MALRKKKKRSYSKDVISAAASGSPNLDYLQYLPPDPKTSVVTSQAIQAGANPKILDKALKELGSQDYNGLCEKFVEMAQGVSGKFASAYDAFTKNKDQIQTDMSKIVPGAQIFYAPDKSNSGWGHTTIYKGNGDQIGATYQGVKTSNIQDWVSKTGQKLLGWLPPK